MHAGVNTGLTLADWIRERYPALLEVGESHVTESGIHTPRPGIVHRLDKETSGAVLIAKDQDVFLTLKKHFQKGKVKKEYHAFVYGRPKHQRGTIRLEIGKSKSDFRKQTVNNIRGAERNAVTEYVVAGHCQDSTSLVKFYPETGRTHQIRVHAQSLQTPVVCDKLYAPKRECLLGFSRLALHARRLTIHTHYQEQPLDIVAPYPEDFEQALSLCP